MTDRPILFSGPMIRALLHGRKSQTRRVLKPQHGPFDALFSEDGKWWDGDPETGEVHSYWNVPFAVGDRLWVREAWSGEHWLSETPPSERLLLGNPSRLVSLIPETWYWADGGPSCGEWERPRPSIHMPRWASRLTLIVTDVRVQRLQEIDEADAVAEGCHGFVSADGEDGASPREDLQDLWDSLNAKRGFGWDTNPWVCAVTFTVHRQNICKVEGK